MICPRCGASTWSYNAAVGSRMCVNAHQTDPSGNDIPYDVTYAKATVPVTVPVEPPVVVGPSKRLVVGIAFGVGIAGAAVVELVGRVIA
jgi:hypothetical protein